MLARLAAQSAALLALLAAPAAAFDTGHHFDLNAAALAEHGFGRAAERQVQVANWVTDYFNTPVFPDRDTARKFDALHFDDLPTDAAVRARWSSLTLNARRAVEEAAARDDMADVLVLLGMSLHAVQDFYSHSNWVEAHPRAAGAPFRTETWFSVPPPDVPIWTSLHPDRAPFPGLAHGDYFHGMNKDSPVRAGWSEAYVFAHAATREWVAAVRGWAEGARPGIWARCARWSPGPAGERELRRQVVAARRLSSWGSGGFLNDLALVRRLVPTGADGHWKGNGSGSMASTLLMAVGGPSPRDSSVAERAIALAPSLTVEVPGERFAGFGMGPPTAKAEPPSSALQAGGRAILVRTLEVRAKTGWLDTLSAPDFYSRVELAGQRFLEAPQQNRARSRPTWTALALAAGRGERLPISYALWDQDYPDPDDPVDLTHGAGPLRFWYEPATGRVGGLPPGAKVARRPTGEVLVEVAGRDAEVQLQLSSVPLGRGFESPGAGI